MPLTIADEIHRQGKKIFLIAFSEVTPQNLIDIADDCVFIPLTRLGKGIRECRKRGVREFIFAGRVLHRFVFSLSLLRFDWTTFKIWWKLPDYRADNLLRGIIQAIEQKGIQVSDSTKYLKKYLAKEGALTSLKPSAKILEDIIFGQKIAKAMGSLDIGQTVIIKDKTIVAVEAMEGTDACIERAGQIAGPGCVVVKMAKPNQDMRFDVPIVGINTLEKCAKIKAAALAIEKDKTILIDENMLRIADKLGLTVIAI